MKTKECNLCRCVVTPTYAMKHLDEFANLICEHEKTIQNLDIDIDLKAPKDSPIFTGIANFSSSNINNRRVNLFSDLEVIVNTNSFVGLVLVNSDSTNDDTPTLYLVYNNIYFWIPSQQIL